MDDKNHKPTEKQQNLTLPKKNDLSHIMPKKASPNSQIIVFLFKGRVKTVDRF